MHCFAKQWCHCLIVSCLCKLPIFVKTFSHIALLLTKIWTESLVWSWAWVHCQSVHSRESIDKKKTVCALCGSIPSLASERDTSFRWYLILSVICCPEMQHELWYEKMCLLALCLSVEADLFGCLPHQPQLVGVLFAHCFKGCQQFWR